MKKRLLFSLFTLFFLGAFHHATYAEMRTSITQYGITWTFDGSYECGQFVTGDWWVVGPVTITSVSPTPASGRHGSMLNPIGSRQGYDDRGLNFDASLRVTFPITLSGINSLVSTVSVTRPTECIDNLGKNGWVSRLGACDSRGKTQDMAVLTIVNGPVAAGTFRPSYIGYNYKEFINESSIDYNVLPRLPVTASKPDINQVIERFERPWLDHFGLWTTQHNYAFNNGPGYGQTITEFSIEIAGSMLLDIPEREFITRLYIQRAIDLYQGALNGARWPGDGGHGSGRKLPMLIAGKLLNHQGMLDIGIEFDAMSNTFGEDCQTYFDSQGFPRWGIRHCEDPNDPTKNDETNNYRFCCTSKVFVGESLIAMILGLRDDWNHEAFFDYTDRWINEGGAYGSSFIQELWGIYRNNLPAEIPYSGGSDPDTEAPTAPTGLSASAITGSSINLSWIASTDNINVSAYDIYIDGNLTQNVNGNLVNTTISDLNCNTTYEITIQARDYAGNLSGFSNPLNVTTSSVCNPVNIALNKTIINFSSQDAPTPVANLLDGNTDDASRWSASGFPQWAEIDLGANSDISQIELYTYQNRAYQYTIEAKTDGGAYTTIVDRSANTSATQPISDVISTSARYIKITVTGASAYTGTWVSLNELKVYDMGGSTTPIDPTSISISPTSLNIDEGQTSQLVKLVLPANATDKSVTWSSSNDNIATVNTTSGLVTAIAEGTCTITATTNVGGLTANCPVTVTALPQPTAGVYYCDPVNGSMSNNGSESSPWSSLKDVINAGKTFSANDIIYLMNGNHGNIVITRSNPGNVIITKYAGHNPEISRIEFNGADNWTLKDVKITANGAAFPNQNVPLVWPVYPLAENALMQITGSDNINIENCYISSIDDNSVWTTADDWNYKAWNGIYVSGGATNVTIDGCHIKNVNFGTNGSATNLVYRNNVVENFCGDGMQTAANYAVIEGNTFMNCYDTNGNHDDLFQYYKTSDGHGLVFRNNKLINYTDPNQPFRGEAQGFARFEDYANYDFIIENNIVITDDWHGITIHNPMNCQVINNTVMEINTTGVGPCWIQLLRTSASQVPVTGNIVRNNLCSDMQNSSNIGIVENNIVVPWSDYDSYFVDFANYDLSLKAGSPAIDAGTATGAPSVDIEGVSRPQGAGYDVGAYEYSGVVINVTGVTLPATLSLEIGEISTLAASIVPSNATNQTVSWVSSAPAVATVNNGVISALSDGQTTITVTTQDGNFTDDCIVTVTVPSGDYNLALGKPFVVPPASDGAYVGANLVDGDVSNEARWSANGFPQSAELDLGVDCNISSLQLYTYQSRAYQYIIEAKAEGGSYSTIVDRSGNTSSAQPITDAVSATARYVKLTVTGASGYTGTWVSINELMVMGTVAPAIINVTSVSVAPTSLTLDEGQTSDLTETVLPVDATDKTVTWSSSNPSVATVNANGLVTAVDAGSAVITATTNDGGFTATSQVTVIARVSSVSLNETSLNLNVGETNDLDETVLPADAANKSVTWSSSNPSVATVNTNGLVSAVDAGSAVITATTNDGGFTAACNVSVVIPQENLALNKPITVSAFEDDAYGYKPGENLVDGDVSDDARWSASGFPQWAEIDLGVNCDISSLQLYTYQSRAYQYTIEAKANGGSYSTIVNRSSNTSTAQPITDAVSTTARYIKITVTGASGYTGTWVSLNELEVYGVVSPIIEPTGVSLNQSTLSLDEGQTTQLAETVSPANATDKSVSWSSSNTSVATVNSSGLVTAVDAGNATITVTTNVGGFTANCNVTVIARVSGVSIDQTALSLDEGETADLNETVLPADAADKSVIWSSSNTSIATVDANGLVNAFSEGNATITVTTNDGGYTATCTVTVTAVVPVGENLSLGKPVTTDSEYSASYPAENAVDGDNSNSASRWLSANSYDDHWIEIDLEQTSTVNKVNFWTGYNGIYSFPVANYQIQYWDGSSWISAVNISGNTEAVVSHSLPNIETDKIRLYTTSTGSEIVRLYEIEVWGEVIPQQNITLNPIADAFVRGGAYADENYGTESILYVKYHTSADYVRETYLKFDLSSVSTVNNAYLRLYVNSSDGSSLHSVAFVSNNSWLESGTDGIEFDNKPPVGSVINQWNVSSAGQFVEVDITSIVATQAGGLLSLQLTSNNDRYIGYGSREGSNPPELVINDLSKKGFVAKHGAELQNSNVKLELWPNPVSSNKPFSISLKNYESDENVTVRIFDISGKMVYVRSFENTSGNIEINPSVKKGVYILNISNISLYLNNKLIVD